MILLTNSHTLTLPLSIGRLLIWLLIAGVQRQGMVKKMATAKEFVCKKYKDAKSEPYWRSVISPTTWVIYNGREVLGEGKTESKAWVNAKKKIIEQEKQNI